ncbi:MAG: DegV family EDD domain-containing protein, partial [Lactobacillus iners]|nr:DegV family EDD domain-containing protein [Lactobacillus iners]
MKKIKIVTDSSAQLTIDEINKYDIHIVPLSITFSDKTYTDGVDISREDFVKKMLSADELPKTSQPSIGLFEDVFKDLASDGSHILGIFLTQSLSGTISAAKQAADLLNLGDNITIIDSGLT